MASRLAKWLGLTDYQNDRASGAAGQLKSVAEFLGEAATKLREGTGLELVEAVSESVPWKAIATAVGEATPVVKFVLKLFEELTRETKPEALGLLACTLAYQRAIEQTLTEWKSDASRLTRLPSEPAPKELGAQLLKIETTDEREMRAFSLGQPLSSKFVADSDRVLDFYARVQGYDDALIRDLQAEVHQHFQVELNQLLSDGETANKFAPFRILLELGTEAARLYPFLKRHVEYQEWLFEKAPISDKERFAIGDVFVHLDCGTLLWEEIKRGSRTLRNMEDRVDPFVERPNCGGREPLLQRVIALLGKEGFRDAIVVQGVAGAGKTSFTLQLSRELRTKGLQPVRIRLRELPQGEFFEAISYALMRNSGDPRYDKQAISPRVDGSVYFPPSLLDDHVRFENETICRYVFIFDGWDDIGVLAAEGSKSRLTMVLEEIRNRVIDRPGYPVRVVITGRPSNEVTESRFFHNQTRVLTIRPFDAEQLRDFGSRIALGNRGEKQQGSITPQLIENLVERYREEFDKAREQAKPGTATLSGVLAVFGLPHLAHLAFRLMAQLRVGYQELIDEILGDSTTLYRRLVDLTCSVEGNAQNAENNSQTRLQGERRETAIAITHTGSENMSHSALEARLIMPNQSVGLHLASATNGAPLDELTASYYFKASRELGCEFVHKSFREYFFAEAIVETIKDFGRDDDSSSSRPAYWKDFDRIDTRFKFVRKLNDLLGPQWLSLEVASHIERLIAWESGRAMSLMPEEDASATRPLSLSGWETVRDELVNLWELWAEDIAWQPKPFNGDVQESESEDPVGALTYRQSLARYWRQQAWPDPGRSLTMDSHFGDALFRLCALVHYHLAAKSGWLRDNSGKDFHPKELWQGVSEIGKGPGKYQSRVTRNDKSWILFAPSGGDPGLLNNCANRINAASLRPAGPFPFGADLRGLDLRDVQLAAPTQRQLVSRQNNPITRWDYSNMENFFGVHSSYRTASMQKIYAPRADFWSTLAIAADFTGAHLAGANFNGSNVEEAKFDSANLEDTNFRAAVARKARFQQAWLRGAKFQGADIEEADFTGALEHDKANFDRVRGVALP